jgi:flagellar L-ring protein precursor FlgH
MLLMAVPFVPAAQAQTSSLGQRAVPAKQDEVAPQGASMEAVSNYKGNPVLERSSLIAIKVKPPKTFKVHDIVTIIVRQQKTFESEAELNTRQRYELTSELEAFVNLLGGGIGAAAFRRGKPNIEYEFESRLRNEGDNIREDRFITRIAAKIVDVKPNGNLAIQATSSIDHEEEHATVTLTGECRSTDVTPDNTILSTQVAELRIKVQNTGAVRDAASRGWITRLLGALKPI